jgi:hypothetical protein
MIDSWVIYRLYFPRCIRCVASNGRMNGSEWEIRKGVEGKDRDLYNVLYQHFLEESHEKPVRTVRLRA